MPWSGENFVIREVSAFFFCHVFCFYFWYTWKMYLDILTDFTRFHLPWTLKVITEFRLFLCLYVGTPESASTFGGDLFIFNSTLGLITVAARSKTRTVFVCSNTGIMDSNPTWAMDVCVRLCWVCAVLCAGSGLATGWSPVQGVLPTS
jgi:hypothetical protein